MTVPKTFRRNSLIPNVLVLHYRDIPASDVDQMYGVKITSPIRTLIDIIEERVLSDDILQQAIFDSIDLGIATKRALLRAGQTNHLLNDFIKQMKL